MQTDENMREGHQIILNLEVTKLCNAVCTFCPLDEVVRDSNFIGDGSIEHLERLCQRSEIPIRVILCGIGEPLLHRDIEGIVRRLHDSGAIVCMTTNGRVLTSEKFLALVDAGLEEISFSVNAVTPEERKRLMRTSDFESVVDVIHQCLAEKAQRGLEVDINVSTVVTAETDCDVDPFVSQWLQTDVDRIWLHPARSEDCRRF